MKRKVSLLHIITVILLIILVASGCQAARKPGPNIDIERKTAEERRATEANQEVIKGEVAADALVDFSEIDDATVLFFNNQAVVAVVLSEGKKGVLSENLKNRIIDTIKDYDENVTRINMTIDKKLFNQIDDIQQSLIRGEQSKTFSNDIEDILYRINRNK